MTKKYLVQLYTAQTTVVPFDINDVEFDGQSYAPDEFDTLEEAQAALARESAEVLTEQDGIGRTLYEWRYSEIQVEEYDDDGDIADTEYLVSNFDQLSRLVNEMQAAGNE